MHQLQHLCRYGLDLSVELRDFGARLPQPRIGVLDDLEVVDVNIHVWLRPAFGYCEHSITARPQLL
jgi:hypothetical protein